MPPKTVCRFSASVPLALCLLAASSSASAQQADYATPDALPHEGTPHVLDVTASAAYARVANPERVSGLQNLGMFQLGARLALGTNPTYCAGLDGVLGGSDKGVVYDITAYPVGIGGRFGRSGTISLCGGAGADGVTNAVPLAARFPAELSIAVDLGPLRPVLWARPSWVAGADARQKGSSLSFVDELEAGLSIRLSREHAYWSTVGAGGGLALGVAYREFMGTRYVAAVLGFDFVGAE